MTSLFSDALKNNMKLIYVLFDDQYFELCIFRLWLGLLIFFA